MPSSAAAAAYGAIARRAQLAGIHATAARALADDADDGALGLLAELAGKGAVEPFASARRELLERRVEQIVRVPEGFAAFAEPVGDGFVVTLVAGRGPRRRAYIASFDVGGALDTRSAMDCPVEALDRTVLSRPRFRVPLGHGLALLREAGIVCPENPADALELTAWANAAPAPEPLDTGECLAPDELRALFETGPFAQWTLTREMADALTGLARLARGEQGALPRQTRESLAVAWLRVRLGARLLAATGSPLAPGVAAHLGEHPLSGQFLALLLAWMQGVTRRLQAE